MITLSSNLYYYNEFVINFVVYFMRRKILLWKSR